MRILPLALAALLTLGVLLPGAIAERPSDAPRARMPAQRHMQDGYEVSLRIEGTGLDKSNETYSFSATGVGKAIARRPDGNVSAIRADLIVSAKLVDANGTVVKEGRVRMALIAREGDDGNWTWHAMSIGHFPRPLPQLLMRGTSTGPEGDTLPLAGHGRLLVRTEEGPLRLRLDVAGALEKV